MKKKIKAILFDVDGALIKSDAALYHLFLVGLIKFGYKKKKRDKIMKYMGSTTQLWIKKLEPTISRDKLLKMRDWIVKKYAKYYMRKFSKPIKYSTEVLKELRKRGYKLAIVTNQKRIATDTAMKIIKFNDFDVIVNYDGKKIKKGKPSAIPIKHALKKLKIKPSEAIFIGDTYSDLLAGKRAKVKTYLLKHRYNEIIDADKINSLKDILKLVE
ncbi:MAG: HAD-IIIA family hydrolase [Candidatus Aenigmarchaeota archaeon]|nr:HAD-IIIA family hydrolase [Candidatus Aenigmarchaeota archaeon]